MTISITPQRFGVSIAPQHWTHYLISNRKEFVLTFPSVGQEEDVLVCGINSGRDMDKFEETKLETIPSSKIDTPLIKDSVACFECLLKGKLNTGDHKIFAGEVVAAHDCEGKKEKIYNYGDYGKKGSSAFKKIIEPEE